MADMTDDQVRALAHRYRFAKDDHERTIAQTASALLNARADAELAVAEAFRLAAEAVEDYPRVAPSEEEWTRYDEQIEHSQRCILAIAPADALAEVQRLKEERDGFAQLATERLGDIANLHALRFEIEAERDAALARLENLREESDRFKALLTPPGDVPSVTIDAIIYGSFVARDRFGGDQPLVPADALNAARAERDAALARVEKLRHQITEASDPDFIWGALDNVHDMDVTLDQFAAAASRAIRAAMEDAE